MTFFFSFKKEKKDVQNQTGFGHLSISQRLTKPQRKRKETGKICSKPNWFWTFINQILTKR